MLFSDITDCEMLVYRCIQEADNEIGLVGIMDELEKKYQKDWKRSTVCTFIAHLIEKGYVNGRREGRVFYYSSAINDKKFLDALVKQFMNFWFDGSLEELVQYACLAKGISKKNAAEVVAAIKELEKK